MRNSKMSIGWIIFWGIAALTIFSSAGHANDERLDSNGGRILKEYKTPLSGTLYARLTERHGQIILTGWNNEDVVVYYPESDQSFNYLTGELTFGDQTIDVAAELKQKAIDKGY